jgi:hypothetical protein
VTSGQPFSLELTESHGFKIIRWVVVEAWFDSPGNTGEPQKKQKVPYKMLAPTSFPRSQAKSFL